MERDPQTTDERLARLEGQYHALSKELTDGLKEIRDTMTNVQKKIDEIHTVKGGLIKSETLPDVMKRLDDEVQTMHKQIVAISNQLQIDQSKIK